MKIGKSQPFRKQYLPPIHLGGIFWYNKSKTRFPISAINKFHLGFHFSFQIASSGSERFHESSTFLWKSDSKYKKRRAILRSLFLCFLR